MKLVVAIVNFPPRQIGRKDFRQFFLESRYHVAGGTTMVCRF